MLLTKVRTLKWKGEEHQFSPTLEKLANLAVELKTLSSGTVNTLLLAQQMLNGTADPVFVAVALRHVLGWADIRLSSEEAYEATISGDPDVIYFRMTYIETVVPNIDFGKKPEGQSPEAKNKKSGRSKKSTSGKSSSPA